MSDDNERCVQRVDVLLRHYRETHMNDDDSLANVMSWVLADFMHWCDRNDVQFDDQIEQATDHHDEEKDRGVEE